MIFDKLLTDPKEITGLVIDSIEKNVSLLLTYLNQNCFNIYTEDKAYSQILDKKFKIYQADLGVYLATKFLERKKIKRIDATAINEMIINVLIEKEIPLIIVGGNFDSEFVLIEAKKRGINLVDYQNGYFEESKTDEIIQYLNSHNNKTFIVGMGVPRQEIFAERLSEVSNFNIVICVGNFLEFYFGTKKRAPVLIRKIGLEWMFRMLAEPKRLWKRYSIDIPMFFYRILKIKLTKNKV